MDVNEKSTLLDEISKISESLLPTENDTPIFRYFAKFFARLGDDPITKTSIKYKEMVDKLGGIVPELAEKDDLYQYAKLLEPTKEEQDAFDEFFEKTKKIKQLSDALAQKTTA
ncbi:MAG TPA: hypothetical protein VG621_01590 [Candidatus Paceibacterota bacterium]|nr:hypothetical protein [Candidatus Paceibacterota bacterium]